MEIPEHLLPHRFPFLMVESIIGYISGDTPVLSAELPIRPSESVFSNAEPPLRWPSVYIIEGLGQCCSLLSLIWSYERSGAANALSTKNVSAVLMNTKNNDNHHTLEQLLETLGDSPMNATSRIGMLASVDVEIVDQVRVGELLEYKVEQTRVFENLTRFAVQASVKSRIVAHGTIVGAQLEIPL